MGYYTKLNIKITLKPETPEQYIALFKRVVIDDDLGLNGATAFGNEDVFKPEIKAEFFNCPDWYKIFYVYADHDEMTGAKFYKQADNWILELSTCFKNYSGQIDKFIKFISRYVVTKEKNECIGWFQPEEMDPVKIYI